MLLCTLCKISILVTGVFGIAALANAGPITVPFSGTVPPKCVFGVPTAGTLVVGARPNQLEASGDRGSLGVVNISCNTAATVTVGDPVNNGSTGGTNFNSPFYGAYIQVGSKLANSPQAKINAWPRSISLPSLPIAAGAVNTSIKVGMARRTTASAIQAGNYMFKVTLTSTP
jgi:hypothetical protein